MKALIVPFLGRAGIFSGRRHESTAGTDSARPSAARHLPTAFLSKAIGTTNMRRKYANAQTLVTNLQNNLVTTATAVEWMGS